MLLNSQAQTVFALGYENAEVDRLTAEARVSIDPEAAQPALPEGGAAAGAGLPLVPLYHERIFAIAGPRVQGVRLHQAPPQVRFEPIWAERDETPLR